MEIKNIKKTNNINCAYCDKDAAIPIGYTFICHTGSLMSARTSGNGGYCDKCNLGFCSLHANWKFPGIPELNIPSTIPKSSKFPLPLSPYCPECGEMMRGYKLSD